MTLTMIIFILLNEELNKRIRCQIDIQFLNSIHIFYPKDETKYTGAYILFIKATTLAPILLLLQSIDTSANFAAKLVHTYTHTSHLHTVVVVHRHRCAHDTKKNLPICSRQLSKQHRKLGKISQSQY